MKDETWEAVLQRMMQVSNSSNESVLASRLGLSAQSVYNARKKQQIPPAWVLEIAKTFNVTTDWLFFGRGPMRPEENPKQALLAELRKKANDIIEKNNDIVMIPLVDAVLSAGGGSFETIGTPRKEYAFRRDFILRKGNPSDMVLMRVSGDSMVPDVLNGDVALIDQSKTKIVPGQMYAVGFEESIYLKRIDNLPGKVILKSANPAYPPVELDTRGDLSAHFRVIGRVLWIGREYK